MSSKPSKPASKKPAKARKPARRGGMGLVGRIALIACGTAIAATLIQWAMTPILLRAEFDKGRLVYAAGASQQLALIVRNPLRYKNIPRVQDLTAGMSHPLPGGKAAIVGLDGALIAASPGGEALVRPTTIALGANPRGGVERRGGDLIGVYPVTDGEGVQIGTAIMSMTPKTIWAVWAQVGLVSAVIFFMVLGVFGFFLLPIARRALVPVTALEQRIRKRDPKDKSKLADSSDDKMLKPLLAAIDEVHERSEAAMRRALAMAYTDPVTRLPNRLRFFSKLEALVDKGQGPGSVYLAVCDIDAFRKLNVAYGPRVADSILAGVAERLRALASQTKDLQLFVGRIGADQFGVIAPGAEQEQVKAFIEDAVNAIAEPMTLEDQQIRITASFGAASAPRDAASAADLFKQAEIALKEAKQQPATRRAFYDARIQEKAKAKTRLEDEIREGLERGEFVAVYQPKVKLETGELVGAEALARWRRPDGSVVSPGRFVPIAEELGLISKLGKSVMRDACFAAAEWHKRGIMSRIAVNVSPHQFDEPDFIAQVYQALDDSGLSPDMLELEITESAAVSDPDRVARIMWPLRNRGVRLAIDDFGTGHSNFASITRLPFDVFKIDQQFIRGRRPSRRAWKRKNRPTSCCAAPARSGRATTIPRRCRPKSSTSSSARGVRVRRTVLRPRARQAAFSRSAFSRISSGRGRDDPRRVRSRRT
jgi:diguanylate cyclase (GGDEF)-like protein